MSFIQDDIYQMIQRSDKLKDDDRLSIFEYLSQKFSIIPLRGGFASPIEASADPDEMKRMANKLKKPIENGWQKWCETIRSFNRQDFKADRAGIACGPASDVLVLDVDYIDKFWKVLRFNGIDPMLPPTFAVKSGGRGDRYHYYFRYPNDGKKYSCRSKAKCFDVRGTGGQVICPGSLHPETQKPYVIATNEKILDAPNWLLEYSSGSRKIFTEEEQDKRSIKKLTQPARYNASGSELLDTGPVDLDSLIENLPISEDITQKIITSYPQGTRSEPSWSVLLGLLNADIDEKTIRSIYQNYPIGEKSREKPDWFEREIEAAKKTIAQNPIGFTMKDSPTYQPVPSSPAFELDVINGLDVLNSPANFEFLIEDFWPKNEPVLITGQGGAGKSIMTLQIAMDLIYPPQLGYLSKFKVISGDHRILFVQSENSLVSLKRRMKIITNAYNIPNELIRDRLLFLGRNGDVRSSGDLNSNKFTEAILRIHNARGFDVLIVDPLISFHDKDENSNDEMRRFLDTFFEFCEPLKVTPLLIHHHGKYRPEKGIGGGRGASAIGDWSANTWELEFVEEKRDNNKNILKMAHHTFTQKKARSYESNAKIQLRMENMRFYPIASIPPIGKLSKNAKEDVKIALAVEALKSIGGTAQAQKQLCNAVIAIAKTRKLNKISSNGAAEKCISLAVTAGLIKKIPVPSGAISYTL